MLSMLAPFAKAIAALLAPLALPLLHMVGLTEVSSTGLETAISMGFSALLVYFIPNKAPAIAA